eukprot:TRINITY_DN9273_c0_g2_i1.p1 TRINITY_DN9273_c0_g2~~TRINITY_DN9273_c0_g2_i1.p1  ORF type:complete len:313 (-),score=54.92 TRINITY_DN9273_c0_g2_i1:12-950(-)
MQTFKRYSKRISVRTRSHNSAKYRYYMDNILQNWQDHPGGYIDTHCNIPNILEKCDKSIDEFSNFKDEVISAVHHQEGVHFEGCISVASDNATRDSTVHLMNNENEIYGAFGIHPLYAREYTSASKAHIESLLNLNKVVAYGEIGLDYHRFPPEYNYASPNLQKEIFIDQIQLALKHQLPIIIHTREAEDDTLQIMKSHIPSNWPIHVHCFTDTWELASSLIECFENIYFGFTGVITFKNAKKIKDVVKQIPLKHFLLETDGPYMAPVPFRGSVAHPGHIPTIVDQISLLKNVEKFEVLRIARENTYKMYGI